MTGGFCDECPRNVRDTSRQYSCSPFDRAITGQGKMRVASCELQVASCELQVASCTLRVTVCELHI